MHQIISACPANSILPQVEFHPHLHICLIYFLVFFYSTNLLVLQILAFFPPSSVLLSLPENSFQ